MSGCLVDWLPGRPERELYSFLLGTLALREERSGT